MRCCGTGHLRRRRRERRLWEPRTNPLSDVILATFGLTRDDTGRFRDCYIGNNEIAVYTRNGGGNRETYQDVIDQLAARGCYLRDEDDDFDSTYATIYFSFPPDFHDALTAIQNKVPFNPDAKWVEMLAKLRGEAVNEHPEG